MLLYAKAFDFREPSSDFLAPPEKYAEALGCNLSLWFWFPMSDALGWPRDDFFAGANNLLVLLLIP